MKFWKEHIRLRLSLITVFVIVGLIAVVAGWKMTGQLLGLGIMIVGVILLLTALLLYNKPFEEPRESGKKSK